MKFFFSFFLFFFSITIAVLSGPLPLAAGQDIEAQPSRKVTADKPAAQQVQPAPAPVVQPQQKTKRNKDKNWPRTFVPTERINADSAVSFPIDI